MPPTRIVNPSLLDRAALMDRRLGFGFGRSESSAPVRRQKAQPGIIPPVAGGFGNLFDDVAVSDVCDLGGSGTGPPFVFSTYPAWMDGSNITAPGLYVASLEISIVTVPTETILQGYSSALNAQNIPSSISTGLFGGGGYPPPPGYVIIGVWALGSDDIPIDVVGYSFNAIPPDAELHIKLAIQRLAWPT